MASVLNDLGVSQRLLGRYDEAESTLRDVPADLHQWLKQQAGAHRRSLNQEVILQLDALRGGTVSAADAGQRLARIRVIAERSAGLPVLDARPEAEILGLGTDGLPG